MSKSNRGLALTGLSWIGILSIAVFVVSGGAGHRKTVTLEMSWKRGNSYYGPNFIHLESACLSNPEPGCFCVRDFTSTRTKEFADYIESFGSEKVPVKYRVDYDRNGQPGGATLESVGSWPAERFNTVERTLGSGSHSTRSQSGGGVLHMKTPSDCFPAEK
jgi:hypothetical protein